MSLLRLASSAALLLLSALPSIAPSQATGGVYTLRKQVIASGATDRANGGSYRLTGTLGQSLVEVQAGGSYRLRGGFHGPRVAAPAGDPVFANGFE